MRQIFILFFIAFVFIWKPAEANETEPNNTRATANILALNGNNSGSIGTSGDVDWFKVATNTDGQLNISFTSDGNNVTAVLYDNDGSTVLISGTTAGSTTISYDGLANGTYYVQLSAYYNTQTLNYTISNNLAPAPVANDPEPDSNRATALTLPLNSTATGHVGYYYNNHRDTTDWYKVTTNADGLLQIKLTSNNGSNISVYLMDNNGVTQLGNLTTAGTNYLNTDGLAAGTYYLQVNSYYNNQFEPYTITDSLFTPTVQNNTEPDSTRALANVLTLNSSTTGHIGYYYNNHRDSSDWYKVTTTADGLLRLTLTSANGSNVTGNLYDNNGTTLLVSGTTASMSTIIQDGLAAGTYYVQILSYYNNQFVPYTLADSLFLPQQANNNEPDSTRALANVLAVNSTTTGHIGYYYNNARDTSDWYKITTSEDGMLQLKLSSANGTNVSAYLMDNNGVTQLSNLTTAGTNYLNTDGLAAGTYYVQVNSYYNSQFVPYTLTDSLFTYNANDSIPNKYAFEATTIGANRMVTGHTNFYYNQQRDSTDWWKINYTGSGSMNLYLNLLPNIVGGGVQNVNFQVYKDTTAAPVYSTVTASATNTFNLSSLTSGYYYIKVTPYYNSQFEAYSIADSFTQVNKAAISLRSKTSTNACSSNNITFNLSGSHSPYSVTLYRNGLAYDSAMVIADTVAFTALPVGNYYAKVYGDGATDSAYGISSVTQFLAPYPVSLTTTNIGVHAATLNWAPVTCASYFRIRYRAAGTSAWTIVDNATNTADAYTLTGLTMYTTYTWQVASVDSISGLSFTSPYSDSAVFTTLSDTAHITSAQIVQSNNCNSSSIQYMLTNSVNPYTVQLYRNSTAYGSPVLVSNTTTFSNLPSGIYYATASGTGSGGSTGISDTITITPPVPAGLFADSITATSATINWASQSCANYFSVQYRLKGATNWITLTSTANSYDLTQLLSDTLYYFQIASVDTTGGQVITSPYSVTDSFTTLGSLPVTFISFSGVIENDKALLNWSTAREINNKGFDVEKSMDGRSFSRIGFVAGHGNAANTNRYAFTDDKTVNGPAYYRLKQLDIDGRFVYSPVIRLAVSKFNWSISGNPGNNTWMQLQLDKDAHVTIQIISMNGSVVESIDKGNMQKGTYSLPLSLHRTRSGMYIVRLNVDNQSYSKKIIR